MEETHVDAEDDAVPANEDVVGGDSDHSDSTQSKARSRKSYTVGFKLAAALMTDDTATCSG